MPLILKKKIKKNKSETLPLKVSSILTNLVIFQGIYKQESGGRRVDGKEGYMKC